MSKSAKKKVDPFKTRKSREVAPKVNDSVTPPEEVAKAIDEFREAQEQAKHFEGEATVLKDTVMNWATDEYSKRFLNGMEKSYKVEGDETMVTYVVMDASAGLTDEDVQQIAERWGEEAAEDLVQRDFRSIRFDPKVLEANYDEVVNALQNLPEEVVENLFKPMLMKAKSGALEVAKKYAKSPEEIQEVMRALKLRHYIR